MVKYVEYEKLFKSQDNFITFYKRNKHIFDVSWYNHKYLEEDEIDYLNILSSTFNVRSPQGLKVPFIPYSWQIDFHANSLLVKGENTLHDFIMKSRGISFSYSALIEAIMVAIFYKGTVTPIMAHRKDSTKELINVGMWLIDNANYKIRYNKDIKSEIQIIHKDGTISKIKPFPSGTLRAVDSVRSLRPVMAIIDEAGANPYFSQMLTAVEESIQTQEAKILIGGTPKGTQNKFWDMHTSPLQGYKKYLLPAFNKHPTPDNIMELKPIVWWYNLFILKNKLMNDSDKFMEEYQCNPFNDSDALIPRAFYENALNLDMEIKTGVRVLAIDPASTGGHLAAATLFKYNKEQFKQENLWYWRNIELPDLENKLIRIIQREKPDIVRIDCKGIGLHLFQNLKRKFDNVEGLRGEMKVGSKKNLKQSLNEFMYHNFEQKIKRGQVSLVEDKLQEDHILNVTKSYQLVSKKGHNDIFMADCMAILPLKLKGDLNYDDIEKNIKSELEKEKPKPMIKTIAEEFKDRMRGSGFMKKSNQSYYTNI
jgi:hypothetical protein